MSEHTLSDSLKYAVRISHTEEGWIEPFGVVVAGTAYEVAKWKPAPDVASIWEIVAHATPYTESRLCDFTGETYPDEEDWPSFDPTPEGWLALQGRVASVVQRLQSVVDALSISEIESPVAGKKTPRSERLMDIAIHDAYHAGQIVKLVQLHSALTAS